MPDKTYLTTHELAARWNLAPGTVENWRTLGKGPRYFRPNGGKKGRVMYKLADVEQYERENVIEPE